MINFYLLLFIFSLPLFFIFYLTHFQFSFLISALFFIVSFLLATHILCSRLSLWLRIIINLLCTYLILLSEISRFISYYIQGEGFNDRFFFHFTLNTIQNAWLTFPSLTFGSAIALFFVGFLTIRLSIKSPFKTVSIALALILLSTSLLLNSAIKEFAVYQWESSKSAEQQKSWTDDELNSLGINHKVLSQQTLNAQAGRNLILIYMESLESIYTDEQYFKALTPNINQLKAQAAYFSDIRRFPNTGWTIAGIVASQCGTPLLAQTGITGNDLLLDGFLNKAVCLGDVLNAAGYEQIFMGGAPHKFAGKGQFFLDHQYNEINGTDELKPGLDDISYLNAWGLYDDSLFDLSYKKFAQLAEQQKPFNLTVLTVDIHAPAGHTSKSCKPYPHIDNKVLDAVYCTDQLIGQFINKVSRHPAYKNTTIVLISDHLSMRNAAEKYYPEKSKRKLEFIVLNSTLQGEIKTTGNIMDMASTLLELIEVKHNAEFLPIDNLLSGRTEPLKQNAIQAIKYINSQKLSTTQTKICPDDQMSVKSIAKNTLQIGEKKFPLYYQGHPISDEDFRNKFSAIVFFDENFEIQNYFLQKHQDIPLIVKKNKALNYLLLEKTSPLESGASGIGIWLGNQLSVNNIGNFQSVDKIDLKLQGCSKNIAEKLTQTQLLYTLDAHSLLGCDAQSQDQYVRYDQQHNILELSKVNVGDQSYQVKLQINNSGDMLWLKSFERIEDNNDEACLPFAPWFFDKILTIPSLLMNENRYKLQLQQEPSLAREYVFSIPEQVQTLFKQSEP